MPDLEISNLPALAEAGVAATDPLAIADISASETKKVTVKDLIEAGLTFIDDTSIPAAKIGTLGTDQVATGAIQGGAVTNVKLANSTISLGGVSIALGGTSATPAFNLSSATSYPASSLNGTITNAQLAGSIVNSKLSNSSVSFGSVSLNLGETDATPAFNLTDATGYKTTELVGTITNAQLAGSIDVSKLTGSAISLGSVSVSLGGTDATPAFNLTDATGYPTSALVGTITNTQLAGSIENAKLTNSSVTLGTVNIALGASDPTPAFNLTDATNYPASSLTGTITNAQLAGSIDVSKLASSSATIGGVVITLGTTDATPAFNLSDATHYPTSALVGTITNTQLAGSIAAAKLVSGSITSLQLDEDSVTDSELANNAVDTGAVQNGAITNDKVETSTSATTGLDGATKIRDASITPTKLNTSNLDRSLNVASGNLGINNAVSGGASTKSGISYNAEGLITGTADLAAADLPKATTSAIGGVSVGAGLSVTAAGALSITNSITANTAGAVKVTYNAQGQITGSSTLAAGDLPTATTSAKGGVQITSGGGLTVDGSGNLITSTTGVGVGTYQSVTVDTKGVVTAGAGLTAALVPDLAASKITTGTIDAARIGKSIDGTKLTNASTALFQSIQQTGTYPTAQFNGQLLFDTVSEDCFIWDGNAWQAITTLTKGSLVFGGTFNATTSKMVSTTSAGIAAGLAVGSNLPTPSATVDGVYVVVSTSGTPSAPAPVVALAPPDYILGVTNSTGSSWNEVDLSQTVAGQVASNITFTPYGQISSTNVQDALQEIESEKLAKAGGEITGELLIGVNGSLVFEGTGSDDAFETTLTVTNPTTSDKTITLPNITGTVITTGDTGTVTGTMIANDTIQNVDIKSDAAIAYSKLASVASGYLLVGNGASPSVAAAVAVTGDISINNAGLTSIESGVIVDDDISGSASITGTKIATGTTSAVGVLQLTNAADSTSTTTAATPAAVKTAKDAADAAQVTADAALLKDGSSLMTGHLQVDNDKEVRFFEADSNGSNYVGIKGATDKASSGSYTISLPAAPPTTGQVLKAGSTATTLEWATDTTNTAAGDLTGTTLASGVTASSLTSVGTLTSLTVSGTITGDVTGTAAVATTITVADESTDTSCNVLFTTAATGNLGAKSGTNLTFNSNTGELAATLFSGSGASLTTLNASNISSGTIAAARVETLNQDTTGTAALATQFTVTANNSTDETVYPLFADGETGSQGAETDTGLTYNPSTGLLTSTGFSGAGTSLTALNASNISSGTIAAARVDTLNQDTTGTSAGLTGSPNITVGTIGCGNITGTGTVSDSKGDLRTIVQTSKSSQHTIVAADSGKHSINSSGGWVINTSTGFTAGQAITLINNSSGDQTITSTGVTLYNSADGSTPTKIATRGMATVICTASNTYYISGAGLS